MVGRSVGGQVDCIVHGRALELDSTIRFKVSIYFDWLLVGTRNGRPLVDQVGIQWEGTVAPQLI